MAVHLKQLNRTLSGDASVQKETKLVAKKKIGNTSVRIYRPELTEEERQVQMKAIYRAIAECFQLQKATWHGQNKA